MRFSFNLFGILSKPVLFKAMSKLILLYRTASHLIFVNTINRAISCIYFILTDAVINVSFCELCNSPTCIANNYPFLDKTINITIRDMKKMINMVHNKISSGYGHSIWCTFCSFFPSEKLLSAND